MKIRPASIDDARTLFAWRNDPLTRAMSKTTDVVEWAGHIEWLGRRLARPEPGLFIAEIDGVPVGTFRVDDGEISYTIAPEHRRLGYAKAMLTLAKEMFGPLRAEIKAENVPSIKAAAATGHVVVNI